MVSDSLSWVIFNNSDCSLDQLVGKLAKEVFLHWDDNKWFWKLGKRGYKNMLIQITTENRTIWIQKYEEEAVSAFPIEWTFFYQDST